MDTVSYSGSVTSPRERKKASKKKKNPKKRYNTYTLRGMTKKETAEMERIVERSCLQKGWDLRSILPVLSGLKARGEIPDFVVFPQHFEQFLNERDLQRYFNISCPVVPPPREQEQ